MSGFLGGGGSGGFTPATGNIVLYVAPTGLDTNPGTSAKPFLTIQHAANVAASYNYQAQYTATINVADGTYAGPVTLPQLVNCPAVNWSYGATSNLSSLIGDTANPANCIIQNASGNAIQTAANCTWNVQGFRVKSTSGTDSDILIENNSSVRLGYVDFAGNGTLLNLYNGAYADTGAPGRSGSVGLPLTSSTTSASIAISSGMYSRFVTDASTWTFNNSPTFSTQIIYLFDFAELGSGAWAGAVTGNSLYAFNNVVVENDKANLPGNGIVTINGEVYFTGTEYVWADATGHVWLDLNVSNVNAWTLATLDVANTINVSNAETTGTGITIINTSAGGHSFSFFAGGSATAPGAFYIFDNTANAIPFALTTTSLGVTAASVIGWSSATNGEAAADTGLIRESAGVVKVTNGAAGYGTIDAGAYEVGGAAGISATITTAKITPVTGANGSMTFTGGILTASTPAT